MFHEILKNVFWNAHGWKFVKMWDQMNFASSIKVETYCKQMQNFWCMPPLGIMDQPTIVKFWNMARLLGQVVCDVLEGGDEV
jgi:hypothetical protein